MGKLDLVISSNEIHEGTEALLTVKRAFNGLNNGLYVYECRKMLESGKKVYRAYNVQSIFGFSDIVKLHEENCSLFILRDYFLSQLRHTKEHTREIVAISLFLASLDKKYDFVDAVIEEIYGETLDDLEEKYGVYEYK